MKTVILNNGVRMLLLGAGVFQIDGNSLCEKVVAEALENGYRLIDTASSYLNEEAVGAAVENSSVDRNEIFLSTKVWVQDFGYEKTRQSVENSLRKLKTDYIDLVLLHQQLSDYYGAWRALEKLTEEGKVRSIGVSNFYPDRLADLCMNAEIKPAVNQIECHPFYQREYDLEVMKRFSVAPMAWAPFAEGGHDIWNNPTLKSIGEKHGKSAAQIVLRWNIERGVCVIPKTVREERLKENGCVFDFSLDDGDREAIRKLDTGKTQIIDHLNVDTVVFLNSHRIHD